MQNFKHLWVTARKSSCVDSKRVGDVIAKQFFLLLITLKPHIVLFSS